MKVGNYIKKDIERKNYAILSYDYEDGCYYIESLHTEKEKADNSCKHLIEEESRKMATPTGWYAIDYMVVGIDDKRITNCMNYEDGRC